MPTGSDHVRPMRPTTSGESRSWKRSTPRPTDRSPWSCVGSCRRDEYEGHLSRRRSRTSLGTAAPDLRPGSRHLAPRLARPSDGRVRPVVGRRRPSGGAVHDAGGWRARAGDRSARIEPGFGSIDEVAWSPDGTRLAFVAAVDPPRFVVGDRPTVGSAGGPLTEVPTTDRPPDPTCRLALGRGRSPRPLVPPVRRAGRRVAWRPSGHDRRGRGRLDRLASGRPDGCVRGRPRSRCRSASVHLDLGVDVDAAPRSAGARPRERALRRRPGHAGRPSVPTVAGSWRSASLDAEPLDDVSPGLLLRRADGSGAPIALSAPTSTGRSGAGATPTCTAGWCTVGPDRSGSTATIVAALTDRGRSLPGALGDRRSVGFAARRTDGADLARPTVRGPT